MQLTEKALTAMTLGWRLSQYTMKAYAAEYETELAALRAQMEIVGVDPAMVPDAHDDYVRQAAFITGEITTELSASRAHLGADGYALPFYSLMYLLQSAAILGAFGENFDQLADALVAVLGDLDVKTDRAELCALIARDVASVRVVEDAGDARVPVSDVLASAHRLANRMLAVWAESHARLARGDDPVGLDFDPRHSCFISYSMEDEAFCLRLYEALRAVGVQVWLASKDMKSGKKMITQIHEAIATHEKLLLVLSETSMQKNWIEEEVFTAFAKEQAQGVQVLHPIRVAPYARVREWRLFDSDSGRDLAREVRAYFIPDFSDWQDDAAFEAAVTALVRDLARDGV